jgi:threonine dehydrogenase-like Zn-dependent dehydrogenase
MIMRAVVARSGTLTCEEVADPIPGAGQVLVKTLSCGICGSDLHALHHFDRMVDNARRAGGGALTNDFDPKAGMVMGHEFSAEVLDYGPDTPARLKAGTRVVSMPILIGPAGMVSVGYSNAWPGGYSERMVLSDALLLEVPNGLSDRQAAMTEPFAVGAHAVAKAALDEDAGFLVIGCGPVGLAVIAALKARGLGPVTAADYSPARRKMAETMGADIIVDPAKESPHDQWSAMGVARTGAEQMMARMGGQAVKRAIIFECVGVPGVLQALIEAAPNGAQIVVAGVCMQADQIEPAMCITKQLDFRFVLGYTPEEFAGTLNDIAEGRIDVAPVITTAVGLEGVAGAFAALADPEAQVKVVVEPALG